MTNYGLSTKNRRLPHDHHPLIALKRSNNSGKLLVLMSMMQPAFNWMLLDSRSCSPMASGVSVLDQPTRIRVERTTICFAQKGSVVMKLSLIRVANHVFRFLVRLILSGPEAG